MKMKRFLISLLVFAMTLGAMPVMAAITRVKIELTGERIYPGIEYQFAILVDGRYVDPDTARSYKFTVSVTSGEDYINTPKVKRGYDDNYRIVFKTSKAAASTTNQTVQLQVTCADKNSGKEIGTAAIKLPILFEGNGVVTQSDLYLTEVSAGTVRFERDLGDVEIIFNNKVHYYTEIEKRVKFGLKFNTSAVDWVVKANPDAFITFYTFEDEPTFESKGELQFDLDRKYLYRINSDKTLSQLDHNKYGGVLSCSTATLGSYAISDSKLSGTGASSEQAPPTEQQTQQPDVVNTPARLTMTETLLQSFSRFGNGLSVQITNKGLYLLREDVTAIGNYLRKQGLETITFQEKAASGQVLSSLTFDPRVSNSINEAISVGVNSSDAITTEIFNKWYSNSLMAFSTVHKDAFGIPVDIAIYTNGLPAHSLMLYAYDADSNSYKRVTNSGVYIDSVQYAHLKLDRGGVYILSSGELKLKT